MITAVAAGGIEADGDKRMFKLPDVPATSRNHPDMQLILAGTIVATPTSEGNFNQEVRRFEEEMRMRKPTTRRAGG